MAEEIKDVTSQYMSIAETALNVFEFKQGWILTNTPALPRADYEERMTKSIITPELIQILRYIYRYTFADRDTIIKQSYLFKKEGSFQNVIIEPNWLKKQLDKLVHLGLVNRRTFIDEVDFRKLTNSGQDMRINWSSSDKLSCYCLTDRGAGFFKRQTECTGFIEETLFTTSPVEVIRRLTTNAVTTRVARNFFGLGEILYCTPSRFGHSFKREIIYGSMTTSDNREIVVFEPVMQYRDTLIQSTEELAQHFTARAEFLLSAVSDLKEKNEGMKITLCFIFAAKSEIRLACDIYAQVLEKTDELLFTNEPLTRSLLDKPSAPAPFFRATRTPKEDGTYALNIRQTFPDFLKRPK